LESLIEARKARKNRGVKNQMKSKLMVAAIIGAAVMFGAAGVASAAGASVSGDCDQTQDQTRLQLKDGSCNECICDQTQNQTRLQLKDGSCNECDCSGNEYSWNHDYNRNYNYSGST
jgi:hypothetical protein